jgi:hypothetical protein
MKHIDWYRTKTGIISTIYSSQKRTSKRRGMEQPCYSREEFSNWLLSHPKFQSLFDSWVLADFDRWLKPSVDRSDDYLPYTLENIQLGTWYENQHKSYHQERSGEVTKLGHIKVKQLTLDGEFIEEYPSFMEAKRQTGIDDYSIAVCAKGLNNKKHAGGYSWETSE